MKNSYRDIFKGTTIIGGSSFIKLLISMVQTKFIAIFLGTFGVGLVHSYNNISGMLCGFCNFGIGNSAVRYISEAAGENGSKEKADAVAAVTFFLYCCIAAITFIVFALTAYPLALLTFKDASYTPAILFLGLVSALNTLGGLPGVLLQSHRKLTAIATSSIAYSILSSLGAVGIYYYFRVQGILIALMLSAVFLCATGWYFIRKLQISVRRPTGKEIREYALPIIKLGSAFFLQGLCGPLFTYVNNLILLAYLGIDHCGLYYCAMNLSGALANFILNAMATDYYPRLVQAVHDPQKLQSMVDEQLDIGVHLALPGLFSMVVFAPAVIFLFYTTAFAPAILAMQILAVGILGRVISWPVGYVLLAKADKKYFILLELASSMIQTLLLYAGARFQGLNGAAASFGIGYLIYVVMISFCVFKKHGVRFGRYNCLLTVVWNALLIGMVCLMSGIKVPILRWSVGIVLTAAVSFHCLRHLTKKMDLSFSDCLKVILRRKAKC